jgi:hypothetical protein
MPCVTPSESTAHAVLCAIRIASPDSAADDRRHALRPAKSTHTSHVVAVSRNVVNTSAAANASASTTPIAVRMAREA